MDAMVPTRMSGLLLFAVFTRLFNVRVLLEQSRKTLTVHSFGAAITLEPESFTVSTAGGELGDVVSALSSTPCPAALQKELGGASWELAARTRSGPLLPCARRPCSRCPPRSSAWARKPAAWARHLHSSQKRLTALNDGATE